MRIRGYVATVRVHSPVTCGCAAVTVCAQLSHFTQHVTRRYCRSFQFASMLGLKEDMDSV